MALLKGVGCPYCGDTDVQVEETNIKGPIVLAHCGYCDRLILLDYSENQDITQNFFDSLIPQPSAIPEWVLFKCKKSSPR